MIYICVLLILLMGVFYFERSSKIQESNRYYWFECIVLVLLMGLRFRVGGDSLRYEAYFANANTFNEILKFGIDTNEFQPLWQLLMGGCKEILDAFTFFQFVHCSLVVIGIFYLGEKHCKYKYTFALFFYILQYPYFCTEIMRESLAVVSFMFAYDYLTEKKYIHYFVLCAVAYLFHAGALFLVVLPLAYKQLSSFHGIRQIMYMSLIILVTSYFFFDIIGSISGSLFADNALLTKKTEGLYAAGSLNIFGAIVSVFYSLPVMFTFFYLKKTSQECPYNRFIVSLYLITLVLGMVYLPLVRLQNYFVIGFLFVFSDFIYERTCFQKSNVLMRLSVFILLLSRFMYYNGSVVNGNGIKHYQMYYPYYSVFNPQFDKERELGIGNQM